MTTTPYLSIVATSRNDDHGKHMRQRMQLFVRGLLHQTKRVELAVELVLVEWNPPADRPLLKDVLPRPTEADLLSIRYIAVPPAVHQELRFSDRIPLFQMIAKNVGIRRAKGQFILCTNVDLLFSDTLFDFLSKQLLLPGHFYRCNRCDIPADISFDQPIPDLLSWSAQHIVQRLGKHHMEAAGRFSLWKLPPSSQQSIWGAVKASLASILPFQAQPNTLQVDQVDTEACGDFTLMSRADWFQLQGYLELEAYSIHIDSLGLYAALAKGIRQVILPPTYCAYHVSHEDGWEQGDPFRKLYKDIDRPMLQWNTVKRIAELLVSRKRQLDLNPENWGLADLELDEFHA